MGPNSPKAGPKQPDMSVPLPMWTRRETNMSTGRQWREKLRVLPGGITDSGMTRSSIIRHLAQHSLQ